MRRYLLALLFAAAIHAQPLAFVDRFQTTLSGGCTAPCSSLSLSSASGLPSGTTYFYLTVKADGGNTEEVFLVTSISGTTATVTGAQATTSASNHGAGATVIASIMTKNAYTQLELDTQSVTVANAASTGTTASKLAKLTGAPSTAVITATTDTGGAIGVVTAGAGTTGNALVQFAGTANCVYDGATTAGNYVQISSSTAGDCHDAGSTLPTSGQTIGRVLSTNGSGGTYNTLLFPPENKASGSSGLTLIEQHTASTSATLDFTTCITSTYDNYFIDVQDLLPATNGVDLWFRVSTDGGSTYVAGTSYVWATPRWASNASSALGSSSSTAQIVISTGATQITNTSGRGGISSNVWLKNPNGATFKYILHQGALSADGTDVIMVSGGGSYNATTAVNAFRFLFSSGNITSGTIRCYGIAK